jgi:hypothetical protein
VYIKYDIGAPPLYVLQEAHKEALCVLHADSVMRFRNWKSNAIPV